MWWPMIVDGINDLEALYQADLSIAMGKGSDIAIDVAKMIIISSDLLKVPAALKLSALTVLTIRQNLFWAFVYNIILIPLAAVALYPLWEFLLDPMIAEAAMALSSVFVVSNSLKLNINFKINSMKNTLKFKTNIKCEGCLSKIKPYLDQAQGIFQWEVDIKNPLKILTIQSEGITANGIKSVIEQAGFNAENLE